MNHANVLLHTSSFIEEGDWRTSVKYGYGKFGTGHFKYILFTNAE